jgi:hypothetical protein
VGGVVDIGVGEGTETGDGVGTHVAIDVGVEEVGTDGTGVCTPVGVGNMIGV